MLSKRIANNDRLFLFNFFTKESLHASIGNEIPQQSSTLACARGTAEYGDVYATTGGEFALNLVPKNYDRANVWQVSVNGRVASFTAREWPSTMPAIPPVMGWAKH